MSLPLRFIFVSLALFPIFFASTSLASASDSVDVASAALFQEHCTVCHGDKGDGNSRASHGLNPPPRNFTETLKESLTRDQMVNVITHGKPGTAMSSWKDRLSGPQIAALVDYVRDTYMQSSIKNGPSGVEEMPGKPLYVKHCGACHGDNGNSAMWTKNGLNPPPRDFTSAEAKEMLVYERMVNSVTHGRPGTAMMSFKERLTDEKIRDVVHYIRKTFMKTDEAAVDNKPAANLGPVTSVPMPAAPVNARDMTQVFPHTLVGNKAKGRSFYMSNCISCHGAKGDGKGPRSSFIKPPPRNFLSQQSRQLLNRPALFLAISKGKQGTVMPAWGAVLSDQEIADVAEFVFQTFIRAEEKAITSAPVAENTDLKKKVALR